ncbi:hypothetical protein BU25DRAFT_493705 [Macroventuria anomochaeta]|uniref:Uncharacterized protein n=1 Tax=Macroventuria anomochaeta TaxID=301207 RepID=A0ACB6RRJ6_9PLEO|nr:uncharacterized protein BU25DRAFT_493705 [Macroventuria anomochaeta]KAF2624423.1 hypothetical protein BU25DRAFT_493705 [Macroventuria anomochaeta]
MTTSKLFKRLFKRRVKVDVGDYNTAASSCSAPSSSVLETITPQQLLLQQFRLQKASPLLSLPGEIRNQIYALAIYPSLTTITIFKHVETVLSFPIFHICHQVRLEAISYLCSSRVIYLSGLSIANQFFEMVGDGVKSLRHVTIRCEKAWREKGEEVDIERNELLGYLELATGLQQLEFVVGEYPLSVRDETGLQDVQSVGAKFLYAVRYVVDGESGIQEERETKERFLRLREDVGALQAVRFLNDKLKEEHEQRAEKVFRLRNVMSLEESIGELKLPVRMWEYLRKTEEDSRRTCYDGRDDKFDF